MNLPGGFFDGTSWEDERRKLHHGDFHYRFYHYLSTSDPGKEDKLVAELSGVLTGGGDPLPAGSGKALRHWPAISRSLHGLFDRAGREAMTFPEALLAELAQGAAAKPACPPPLAAIIRADARQVLVQCAERSRDTIDAALAEPRRLLAALDEFVTLFQDGAPPVSLNRLDAERRVREFLDDCRRFDGAVSANAQCLRRMED